jgi:hypothetical protein
MYIKISIRNCGDIERFADFSVEGSVIYNVLQIYIYIQGVPGGIVNI